MKRSAILITSSILFAFSLLAGCQADSAQTKETKEAKKTNEAHAEKKDAVKQGAEKMLSQSQNLSKAIKDKDARQAKEVGDALNQTWFSFENKVRKTAPMLYNEVEKYLTPLVAGTKVEPLDDKTLSDLKENLVKQLNKLKTYKPDNKNQSSTALNKVVRDYHVYIKDQTKSLVSATKAFTDAVTRGNIDKAKKVYPEARTYYERIEPIAESLGELDPKIDARENDVADPSKWTGFHEIEKAIWVKHSVRGQEKYAKQLMSDVKALDEKVNTIKLEPAQVIAGAVELLNEASISKITGEEERYSHIDLVDLAANAEGSKVIFDLAKVPLKEKDADLAAAISEQFKDLNETLQKYQKDGSYVLYNQLDKKDTRTISQQLNALSESLSKVAKLLS
ncbi:iron uptake system component EfeO [Scopulibacillus darangshiensis]|uniref:Iron uptake system component EfeO n=1 Tax=Scopulibacillus darangshiensis TaxID=442528 RepID=A0A4R2NKB6_9BACL|nr:iron uptake system protein EfeO [Scopulibacillus darangshiensis]TCP21930.1 iron uptake system component EfeO [Scopulibacillus darangshiensis]